MNISGDFYNVYKFFYKLAVMKRIVDVHNVAISRASKENKVSVSFNGTAFSFIGKHPAKPAKNTVKKAAGAPAGKTGGTVKK
jgi:Tfp pilus assembly protein PilO